MNDEAAEGEAFRARLREEMAARGWTAADLARRAGAGETTVREWLAGRKAPTRRSVRRVADALGGDPEAVLRLAGLAPDRGRLRGEDGGDG